MWNCEDSTEVNATRLQNNYCVVTNVDVLGFHERNSCACKKEELWTPLLCAQSIWTCDERNSHAFDS